MKVRCKGADLDEEPTDWCTRSRRDEHELLALSSPSFILRSLSISVPGGSGPVSPRRVALVRPATRCKPVDCAQNGVKAGSQPRLRLITCRAMRRRATQEGRDAQRTRRPIYLTRHLPFDQCPAPSAQSPRDSYRFKS